MTIAVFGFEVLVALLLVGAGVLCWRLDRRLSALRSGQDGLQAAMAELAGACAQAEASVRALRAAEREAGGELQARIEEARGLAEELRLIAARAPDRASARASRPRDPAAPPRATRLEPEPAPAPIPDPAGPEGRRLLQTLRTMR